MEHSSVTLDIQSMMTVVNTLGAMTLMAIAVLILYHIVASFVVHFNVYRGMSGWLFNRLVDHALGILLGLRRWDQSISRYKTPELFEIDDWELDTRSDEELDVDSEIRTETDTEPQVDLNELINSISGPGSPLGPLMNSMMSMMLQPGPEDGRPDLNSSLEYMKSQESSSESDLVSSSESDLVSSSVDISPEEVSTSVDEEVTETDIEVEVEVIQRVK